MRAPRPTLLIVANQSPWDEVKKEMVEEKGLEEGAADKIGEYVRQRGQEDLLEKLQADAALTGNETAKKGLDDMALLFMYLKEFNVLSRISFDMSLARGLDYYTGVIYEIITEGSAGAAAGAKPSKKKSGKGGDDEDRSNDPTLGVGSVAGGGRYDELVGMFSGKQQIPCVGISFGVDRIFSIIKSRLAASPSATLRSNEVDVYVMAVGGKNSTGLLPERMRVCTQLWDAGIKAEFQWKAKPKLQQQFKQAENGGVPFAVIFGEDEWKRGMVKIKEMGLPEGHPEKDGIDVSLESLPQEVKQRVAAKAERDAAAGALEGLSALSLAG